MASGEGQLGYEDERFQSTVSERLHCVICFNVYKDPVMCRNNQHYFCRSCITEHLSKSKTCPICMDQLTVETLAPVPRILRECLSELVIKCDYFSRGCREFIQLENLQRHTKECGFSPVTCSNEGCFLEINKKDQPYHESEVCKFRRFKCHDCVEVKEKLGLVVEKLNQINEDIEEIKKNQTAIREEMKTNQAAVNDKMKASFTEIKDQLATLTCHIIKSTQKEKLSEAIGGDESHSTQTEHNVIVVGGLGESGAQSSAESLCWSTKLWAPLQPMKEHRDGACSFVIENQLVVNGGLTDRMEGLVIDPVKDTEPWVNFPAKLPTKLSGHCSVVYDGRLIVVGGHDDKVHNSIHEVALESPYTTKLLTRMSQVRCYHGAELVDNDCLLICGGTKTRFSCDSVDNVVLYDINANEFKAMAPLPYPVNRTATVRLGGNVIVIGGADRNGNVLSRVFSYDVKTGKSNFLPEMKYKRSGSVAIVVDNSLVVMGGEDEKGRKLRSVEKFCFDSNSWEELPPMNEARYRATCVAW